LSNPFARRIIGVTQGARMNLKTWAFGIAAGTLAATPALAGDKVLSGAPPAWVVAHAPGAQPAPAKDAPIQFEQLDSQVRFDGDTQTTFTLLRLKFLTPQGLQAGNLSYSWEPDKGDLTVNRVLIHRGDRTIDVLGAGQTFTVLRREQGLDQATIDGALTANMFPEGLQVGDVLETAVTVTRTDPVAGDHGEVRFGPLNFPAGAIDLSLQWPSGRPMALAETPDLPKWTRTSAGGFDSATLSLRDVKPVVPPGGAPDRFAFVRLAEASDYRSWDDVAAVNVPLYARASAIPADGPLRAEVDKIRAAGKDPVARAEAALQLVQNRIRYVALEMGAGGLTPADAATTWSRRYGDCKAKTALLVGILHALGIEADPVVVATSGGDAIAERLPAIGLFNHILVRATIAEKAYWLDGTRTGDTRLARLKVPDFGWGLPIRAGVTGLVRMIPPPLEEPESDMAIEFDASKGVRGPVPAKLELTLRGDDAAATNQVIANLVGNAREEALRKFWRDRFDFIEPKTTAVAFDQDKGELRLTMQGTATLDWKDGWYQTDETGVGYRADFSRADGPQHDAPFAVAYPLFNRTRETVLLPPTFVGKVTSDKADVDEAVAGIHYYRHAALTGNTFVVERTTRSLVPEIAFKDAVAAQKRLRDLANQTLYLRIPNVYRPTEGDLAAAAAETSNDDEAAVLALGNAYLTAGKNPEALERFVRATSLDPTDATAWADRAMAEAYLGKLGDATASLDKAAAIDPANLFVFHGRGIVADQRKAYTVAIDAYSKAIAQSPNDDFAYGRRAYANYGAGNMDAALADARKATDLQPDFVSMYGMRANIYMMQKKPDQAVAEIRRMVAANPSKPQITDLATRMLSDMGLAGKAGAIAGAPGDFTPSPQAYLVRARLRDAKDTDAQIADLDQALKLDADFVPALATRAELLYAKEKYDAALADIDRALGHDPHEPNFYLLKANILRNLGRRDDALAVAQAVASANPEIPLAHVVAGKIYQAFERHADAVAAIDRAIALAPEPYMYLNRAAIRAIGDLDARLADIELALKADPGFTPALAMKANVLSRRGDHAGAAKIYDTVVASEPSDSGYLVERGIERWRAGRQAEAEQDFTAAEARAATAMEFNNLCYEKAAAGVALERALKECNRSLELSPGSAATLDSRATVYLQMGRFKEARADYDLALARLPTMAPSLLGRAIARLRLGDGEGARADLAAARKVSAEIVESFRARGIAVPPELVS
jgi:tetratricopeptide (TPR) repeat protein